MEYKVKELEKMIAETVEEVCGVPVLDYNLNLNSNQLDIPAAEFLYVFDDLEKKLDYPAASILADSDYTIFTVHNLATALHEKCVDK